MLNYYSFNPSGYGRKQDGFYDLKFQSDFLDSPIKKINYKNSEKRHWPALGTYLKVVGE
jgi:hypothetical protein